ncbi:S-layer homology domain-containing protein [Thermobacillus sp. ZCTH02-B1]|uniref:S-layer homology domain-containing protein n=1 Tax=Thermobacillus sp. ZCTH02-B1 TaxID=1858795 RepID=UPI0025E6AF09|nr:S-layer homology domain-containing protein [Thermobacillus sp. ZCTH02-B1]
MKRSLSLLVAIAMVFSMFATVVAAEELDTQAKFDILKEAGIFEGMPDGSAGLDQEMTRAQFAVVIYRIFEAIGQPLADAPASFNDVADTHWAVKEIGAVQNAGYMEGRGKGKFDPSAPVKKQELVKVVSVILGLELDPSASVSGKASPWAQPYLAAAEKAGLIQPQDDYTVNAPRGYLVDVTYSAYQQLQSAIKVTATAKQTGAKKVEVKFSKPIDDSKATFVVKNGLAERTVDKYTVSDDKKTVVLELTTKLQSADSTVTIKGVESEDIVANFTAEQERVAQVKFKSDKLALSVGANNLPNYTEAKVGYQILNQFGEEVSNVGGNLVFQAAKATAQATANNGVLTIKTSETAPFYVGETVVINGYLHLGTYAVTVNETLTVGQPATVDSVEIKGLYHPENKEINTNSTFSDYVLLIEVKDQYGNKLDAKQFNAGAFVTVSNPGIFQVPAKDPAVDNQGPEKDQVGIPLADPVITPGFEGTNIIRITTLSGKQYTYNVEVKKAATVQKITLLPPSEVIAANDGTVKIPFVAEDQFGNEVKKYSDLVGKITLSPDKKQKGTDGLELKQDYVTKEAYIELTLPAFDPNQQIAVPYPIMAWVNGTSSSSQLTLSIEKPWYPESIVGLTSDVSATLAVNATTEIKADYVKVKDNYGRDKKLSDLFKDGYKVVVSVADGTEDVIGLSAPAELSGANDTIKVTAKQKGSDRIKVQLFHNNELVYSYESFVFTVVDSNGIVEYAVEDVPKMSNKANREVELKVVGKRSNGTTVALPVSAYTVTTTNGLTFSNGKLSANGIENGFDNGELKAKVVVTILATGDRIEKEVVVSNATLVPATIELKDANGLKASDGVVKGSVADLLKGNGVIQNVFGTLKIKDQFGFEMNAANKDEGAAAIGQFTATVVNIDDVDDKATKLTVNGNGGDANTVTVTGLETGDSFTVIFTSKASGVSISVRVVAEE